MSLKRLCVCGEMIDATDKYCSECADKVKATKTESNRVYDTQVRQLRDKKYDDFYHTKQWRQVVEKVKHMYNYMDIYSYYVLHDGKGKVEYGTICHHVRELKKDGWNDRLNVNAIVYLTHNNHTLIHKMLEQDYEGTVSMLLGLMARYKEEFK